MTEQEKKREAGSAAAPGEREVCIQWARAFLSQDSTELQIETLANLLIAVRNQPDAAAAPSGPGLCDTEIACIKLNAIVKHLNISGAPEHINLLEAVAEVEKAAEWARFHIEERGKQNDELRAALAAHPAPQRDYQIIADNLLASLKLAAGNVREWLKGWLENFAATEAPPAQGTREQVDWAPTARKLSDLLKVTYGVDIHPNKLELFLERELDEARLRALSAEASQGEK